MWFFNKVVLYMSRHLAIYAGVDQPAFYCSYMEQKQCFGSSAVEKSSKVFNIPVFPLEMDRKLTCKEAFLTLRNINIWSLNWLAGSLFNK
jgi:hypothetical protein